MNAAPSLVCVMEGNVPTLLVAMCAPVQEATFPAQTAPDVWISVWAPVSLLWLTAAAPRSLVVSTRRCSVAVTQDAAGLWDRSLRCALLGALTSLGVYVLWVFPKDTVSPMFTPMVNSPMATAMGLTTDTSSPVYPMETVMEASVAMEEEALEGMEEALAVTEEDF